jgi:hypothetical protein
LWRSAISRTAWTLLVLGTPLLAEIKLSFNNEQSEPCHIWIWKSIEWWGKDKKRHFDNHVFRLDIGSGHKLDEYMGLGNKGEEYHPVAYRFSEPEENEIVPKTINPASLTLPGWVWFCPIYQWNGSEDYQFDVVFQIDRFAWSLKPKVHGKPYWKGDPKCTP